MNRRNQRPEDMETGTAAQEASMEEGAAAQENMISSELEALAAAKDKAERERDEFLSLAQRVKADFDNYKRRNQTAREDAYNDAVFDTLGKFLPVLDNLDRAACSTGGEEALREGLQLVLKQFNGILAGMGVEEIAAQDCAFDPNLHHAVMQEAVEGCECGKVIHVLQKGYSKDGKVIRHSMVKVSE